MKLIRCQKCGTMVISEESFLQNVLDMMEDACRSARRAKSRSERNVRLQEAAEYKAMYKSFMHHLTERDRAAHNDDSFIVTEFYNALVRTGKMDKDEFNVICQKGQEKAAVRRLAEEKEINAIYGNYNTICNRTKSSPVEKAALKNCR